MDALTGFVDNLVRLIIQPLVVLLLTAGVAYFIWGVGTYLWKGEKGEDRSKAAQNMLWGLIGLVIMVAVVGLLEILTSTFGV
ncbi:MAG: hypothetical protein AAB955_02370 [Patescibacteria group bacterium]